MSAPLSPRDIQRRGADPRRSAFVMANAGSGKTRVLTERVARLLMADVDPQKILCLTFTKAAAGEMSARLFDTLGKWALMDDAALIARLEDIESDKPSEWNAEALARIRRLFARALETPGGLKIQTIHSFCESVLKRFPLEAGAPPGFNVIDDAQSAALASDAIDDMARASVSDRTLRDDIARLSRLRTENDLRAMLSAETRTGLAFDAMAARHNGIGGAVEALAAELGVDPLANEREIRAAFLASIDHDRYRRVRDMLAAGSKEPKARADAIAAYLSASASDGKWAALENLFLTEQGGLRKRLVTKALEEAHPENSAFLSDEQARFVAAVAHAKALAVFHDTAAYYRIVSNLRARYQQAKAARAALDFEDLIVLAQRLLETEAAAWVRYKLDYGIDHILVDETQDTSPDQWRVIEALLQSYLGGADHRDGFRTFFAVGDVKQSIYSFQGADARVFEEKELNLGKALAAYHGEAGGGYDNINMQTSFRTTAPVLQFVDEVFRSEDASDGLGKDGAPAHRIHRQGAAGLVELWPLTPRPELAKADAWDKPVDAPAPDDPVRVLCDRVAGTIRAWLDEGEMLASAGRPICPEDILILVQSRGRLFDGVLGALARRSVPVAGADRLKLMEEPAVEDLISYAKFCVSPQDDLSLAEVLKSPLFGFEDDGDLFPIAYERDKKESLWRSLNRRADEQSRWQAAATEISEARAIALAGGPFAFFSHVLQTGEASGRQRFYARLTRAARDGVDELLRQALHFERLHPLSLVAFINWFRDHAGEVKRELDQAEGTVRIMTVHGSKGLEANIVFLLDAHRHPNTKDIAFPLPLVSDDSAAPRSGRLRALVGGKDRDTPTTASARKIRKEEIYREYRRLYYVAATRARDRLYIAGIESGRDKDPRRRPVRERSWHALAEDAFERFGDQIAIEAENFWPESSAPAQRLACLQTAPVERDGKAEARKEIVVPDWLFTPAARETAPLRIAPSRLADETEAQASGAPPSPSAHSPTDADRYFRGRVLHRLLELLPGVADAERAPAAMRLLGRLAPDLDDETRALWRDEVLAVFADPAFAAVFGPGSRAEVGVAGEVEGKIVNGQLDRLIVEKNRVLIVDYKTNRPPPRVVEDTPPAYLAQMAAYRAVLEKIYPNHQVECALLWTFEARIVLLPQSLLDRAYDEWVRTG